MRELTILDGMLILTVIAVTTMFMFFHACASFSHDVIFTAEKLKTFFPHAQSFGRRNLSPSDAGRARIEGQLKNRLPEEYLKPSIYGALFKELPETPPEKTAAIIFIDA